MKLLVSIGACTGLLPVLAHAAALNLATLSCGQYESQVLPESVSQPVADNINTVMWLLGYSVGSAGAHVLDTDALSPFGFALDGECKENPKEMLLDALRIVRPEPKNALDLRRVECAAFASRHVPLTQSDPESATTVMMWLFGFSTARSAGQVFDVERLQAFEGALLDQCAKHPKMSLLEALAAVASPKKGTHGRALRIPS